MGDLLVKKDEREDFGEFFWKHLTLLLLFGYFVKKTVQKSMKDAVNRFLSSIQEFNLLNSDKRYEEPCALKIPFDNDLFATGFDRWRCIINIL